MPDESHYRKLENMYGFAPCNAYYKPDVRISEGKSSIFVDVREDFFHSAGAVHGCVYFKLLDDTAFFAVNSVVEDVFVLTTSFTTYITRPVSSGIMRAEGELVHANRSQFITQSVIYDAEDREIGRASGVFVRGKVPLTEDIGCRL